MKVFVYGTLKRSASNHHWLKGAWFLGQWCSPPCWQLYSLESYPVLCPGGRISITGEIYRITPVILDRLDFLEDYPREYQRMEIKTPWGPAWVYYQYQLPAAIRSIPSGRWPVRGQPLRYL